MSRRLVLLVGILLLTWFCSSEPPHPPPPQLPVKVTLSPETANMHVDRSLQFTATVKNTTNASVTWSLSGDGCNGASCGTISSAGLYTAPQSVPDPPYVTVKATSSADTSKSATAAILLLGPVVVTVRPPDILVTAGAVRWFGAVVDNVVDSRVTWSLAGATGSGPEYGTISNEGMYTAPAAVPGDPVVTITATSVEDPGATGSTTATIRADGTSEITWTWVSGSDTANQLGIYGMKGVPAPSNVPGSRVSATSWIDSGGNLWLFGGFGPGPSVGGILFNDLWKYDPATDQWTWVSGSNTSDQPGVYGTKGVADPLNVPGSKENPMSWSDPRGKLWLFGGMSYDALGQNGCMNDLWSFDTATAHWTYVSGFYLTNEWGIYGTKGVPAPSNAPGARYRGASWIDAAGKLWLFGGWGFGRLGGYDRLNDLWKFDPETSEWAWISGSDVIGDPGEYGTKGVPSPLNAPGARCDTVTWIDPSGKLWLFGGFVYSYHTNDLWRFDPASAEWTWMSGSDWPNEPGFYGTKGVPDPRNVPGARSFAVSWADPQGRLWLFGGVGYDSDGSQTGLNDLWRYDPMTNEWTWVAGSDLGGERGSYGTKGVPEITNFPGARSAALSGLEGSGRFWLWGGGGIDSVNVQGWLNDLWHFTCLPPGPAPDRARADRH